VAYLLKVLANAHVFRMEKRARFAGLTCSLAVELARHVGGVWKGCNVSHRVRFVRKRHFAAKAPPTFAVRRTARPVEPTHAVAHLRARYGHGRVSIHWHRAARRLREEIR